MKKLIVVVVLLGLVASAFAIGAQGKRGLLKWLSLLPEGKIAVQKPAAQHSQVCTIYASTQPAWGIETSTSVKIGGCISLIVSTSLPTSGYKAGTLCITTTGGATLYISTENVVGTQSWVKVGAQ